MINIDGGKWDKIKAEYIAGETSYRKLARKHGVSFNTLAGKARKECWADAKKQARDKATTVAIQKTANTIIDCTEVAEEMKLRLLLRLKLIEEKYPFNATEIRSKVNGNTVIFRLRDLTAAYKDITENMPKEEDTSTMEKLDKMLAEVRSHAFNT